MSRDQGSLKAWLLADWFVRDFAPVWLSALGPDDPAVVLRGTPELRSLADIPEAQRRIDAVGAMINGVTGAVGGTTAERDLAADVTTSCIGGLTDYTNLVTAQGGEALGSIAYQALKLAGIAGTNYLVAGIHRAPPMFRNDPAKLQAALRQALQPTVDASNAAIQRLGERLNASAHEDEALVAAPTDEEPVEEPTDPGDDDGDPVEIAGQTYDEVIASVQAALTGDFQHDGALITSVGQSCGEHPQAKEIRRELGRLLHAIAPDEVKAKFDQVVEGFEGGFEPGLAAARAKVGAGDVAGARSVLEDLVRRYGSGTGLFHDDTVSEYRHFRNDFELALYAEIYQPSRKVRKLPQDRATLYSLYGSVLLELRDTDGAEAALRESLRANPVNTEALFELGEVMKLTRRMRECREITLRAMTVAYTQDMLGRGYRNLGYLAVEDEDYDLAVACYAMSLVVDRDNARAAQSELFYIQQVTRGHGLTARPCGGPVDPARERDPRRPQPARDAAHGVSPMRQVQGSKLLYTTDGDQAAYLPDGRELKVVVTTEDGSIGVLTDYDHWYVASLRPTAVVNRMAATIVKVHGGKPYAYRDAERLAEGRIALTPDGRRTTTAEQDRSVATKAPFFIAGVVVLAIITPPILLIVWVPLVIFLALAWRGSRMGG